MAGVAMWTIAIPPNVIKSRLQFPPSGQYKVFMDVLRHLLKTDGPSALFKDLGPALLRAFPVNAVTFLGYEAGLKSVSQLFHKYWHMVYLGDGSVLCLTTLSFQAILESKAKHLFYPSKLKPTFRPSPLVDLLPTVRLVLTGIYIRIQSLPFTSVQLVGGVK
ncbi:10670_t:CDS:2 [Dentiscutata heterogama]|uniref:10670_t:CDS:1 n=1 Tax=Dentiscutata heterogama TaxID=1316150 RepID=A0ACA9KGC3_9GLOM|nr:10670_t:CDS:2 [Dentiscutata heterogama]